MKKVTRKLIPLLLAIAMLIAFLPMGRAEAATSNQSKTYKANYFTVKDKTWKWYKDINGEWRYGNKKTYAYLGFYTIGNNIYAFDKGGYLITNAFIEDKWVDNNGKVHKGVTGEWIVYKGTYWCYKITNKEGFKQKGYLSGKKTEWFGTSATGNEISAVMDWAHNGGYKNKITFTKNGYAKYGKKTLTVQNHKIKKGCRYVWTPLYGRMDYDSKKLHNITNSTNFKKNIDKFPNHTVWQDSLMPL